MKAQVTIERLRNLMSYEPDTGNFQRGNRLAGYRHKHGYWVMKVDGREYKSHRLAWLYMTGEWPAGDIDHINGVRDDNRFANLRAVTRTVNCQNRRIAHSNNVAGFLGVKTVPSGFQARIWVNGGNRHLGSFATPELAHQAYLAAKRELHEGGTL